MKCEEQCEYINGSLIERLILSHQIPDQHYSIHTALSTGFSWYLVSSDFRAVGDYQLDYSLDFSLLSRQATVSVTPSLASRAHGYKRMGGRQYATVTLEGTMLDASLPLTLWQDFLQWPLTAR